MHSTTYSRKPRLTWRLLAMLPLLWTASCCHGSTPKPVNPPPIVVRESCLKRPPLPTPDPDKLPVQLADRINVLATYIIELEQWERDAWAVCQVKP
jgi:hypothetical protein